MNGNEIRTTFTEFFAAREHAPVPSASLIPIDPTLLLTNAGMVPFKPYLLGEETPPWPRAVTVQKCARTVDIDIIGTTARHLTFFEMLGNFSFGDYFKEGAIHWAYELITEGFGLDAERLWYSVHVDDDEAAAIWIDGVGVPAERLQRFDKENFWQMGVPGPAGPSSEIFYDKGPEYGEPGGPAVDEERHVEFWNLVFMQYVQDEPYHVVGDLPARNIDTGAGLERLATLLQGVETLFEVDTVREVLVTAENATGVTYGADERSDVSLRIIADHGRAVTFLIGDRVVPSNEGRGYVLRRLIRRATRHAFLLGTDGLIMPKLVDSTVAVMGEAYPALAESRNAIVELVEREEEQFLRTLHSGHQLLDEALMGLDPGGVLPGETAFKLHDTYGFPRELTEEIASERGFLVDLAEFNSMMEEQRTRARAAYRGGDAAGLADTYRSLLGGVEQTDFTGYDTTQGPATILTIFREGESVDSADEDQDVEIFFDRSPFYAESGGQIGDSGTALTLSGTVRIFDTQYALPGLHGHRGTVTAGTIQVAQEATLEVDGSRRERIRKNHTGTHLLHWALREVVGDHVHQAGSLVASDRLRFDFSHHGALSREELAHIERVVNDRVIENAGVTTLETSKQEAEKMGALAFFGDKYGERVRVVKAGDYSTEFCGGTHVPSTGQIGPLVLVSESSIQANTRRVEALTGSAAYSHLADLRDLLHEAAGALRTQPNQLVAAATSLNARLKEQEDRIAGFEDRERSSVVTDLVADAEEIGRSTLVVARRDGLDGEALRALAFQLRDRLGSGIGIVGSVADGKGALVAFASEDLVAGGVSAGELIGDPAKLLGGGGSRDPKMAQAGGPNGASMDDALEEAKKGARGALTSR